MRRLDRDTAPFGLPQDTADIFCLLTNKITALIVARQTLAEVPNFRSKFLKPIGCRLANRFEPDRYRVTVTKLPFC